MMMKKKFLVCAMVVTAMLTYTACGKKTEEPKPVATTEATTEAATTEEAIDIVDTDFSKYAGAYYTADSDSITIDAKGNVVIDLFRLTEVKGTATGVEKGVMSITGKDASGNDIGFEYLVDSRELIVVDSTWEYLKNGTSYTFDLTKAPEVAEPDEETEAVADDTSAEGDMVEIDFSAYAGEYATENEDTLTIDAKGNVVIGLVGLTEIEGTATGVEKGIMSITGKDASGNDIGFEYLVDTKELVVVDSTWDGLANGDTYVFDK